MPLSSEVERRLESATGYSFSARQQTGPDGPIFSVRLSDLPVLHGFSTEVLVGWHSLTATFVPDTFAADLLKAMSNAPDDAWAAFCDTARSLSDAGYGMTYRLDGQDVDPGLRDGWPESWESLELKIETPAHELDGSSTAREVADLALAEMSLLLSLLPILNSEANESEGEAEGLRYRTVANKYERSAANRAACIALKGTTCTACGLKLEDVYGLVGRDFIEVHHSTPVSQLAGRPVDVLQDLHPLCPNCHAIVHRTDPPMEVDRLRALLSKRDS